MCVQSSFQVTYPCPLPTPSRGKSTLYLAIGIRFSEQCKSTPNWFPRRIQIHLGRWVLRSGKGFKTEKIETSEKWAVFRSKIRPKAGLAQQIRGDLD
ncbi:MAG: hypothetical protein ACI80I_003470, partial [Akkermansiaceae bacterium]